MRVRKAGAGFCAKPEKSSLRALGANCGVDFGQNQSGSDQLQSLAERLLVYAALSEVICLSGGFALAQKLDAAILHKPTFRRRGVGCTSSDERGHSSRTHHRGSAVSVLHSLSGLLGFAASEKALRARDQKSLRPVVSARVKVPA